MTTLLQSHGRSPTMLIIKISKYLDRIRSHVCGSGSVPSIPPQLNEITIFSLSCLTVPSRSRSRAPSQGDPDLVFLKGEIQTKYGSFNYSWRDLFSKVIFQIIISIKNKI